MSSRDIRPVDGQWQDNTHVFPIRVYYEDTDFTGVVYYANYLKFFERGRTEALRSSGVSHTELFQLDPPLGFVVRQISVDYMSPARVDDALIVETHFEQIKGARMIISQTIRRSDEVLATAHVEAACIDMEGRPRRLPQSIRDQFKSLNL